VPEAVAQVEHAAAVVRREDFAFLVQVRDVVHERVREALLVDVDGGARRFNRAEIGREVHLLVVFDLLAGEHEHRMPVHGRFDLSRQPRGNRLAQVDTFGTRADVRVKGCDREGHAIARQLCRRG